MKIELVDRYTPLLVMKNRTKLFVFGDNLKRQGKRGQAVIRDYDNAMGIATKKLPTLQPHAFMTDDEFSDNVAAIDNDIMNILIKYARGNYTVIVFPTNGLGTGLAKLKEKAPRTYTYLYNRLGEEFGVYKKVYINPYSPESEPLNAFVYACEYGSVDDVQKVGDDIGEWPLDIGFAVACHKGNISTALYLFGKGEVDFFEAFIEACTGGSVDMVSMLLDLFNRGEVHDIKLDEFIHEGLASAIQYGHTDIQKLLLENGASMEMIDLDALATLMAR